MFGRKNKRHTTIDTLVGPNSRVQGDLHFEGGCHVDGTVQGNVSADSESDSALSISENGTIEGNVTVPHVVLKGTVRGDLAASERVELGPTARVIGNVYYNLIEMAIGAEINGKLVHGTEKRAGQTADEDDRGSKTGDTAKMPAPKIATGAK
ncbi:bactofilin family protein [Lentisalinibacter salinarum]|uniref:bactofilin family protein n=1 Tax=Lentisalinibacter salinarum TaxID=2992239 RepID=UPI003864B805